MLDSVHARLGLREVLIRAAEIKHEMQALRVHALIHGIRVREPSQRDNRIQPLPAARIVAHERVGDHRVIRPVVQPVVPVRQQRDELVLRARVLEQQPAVQVIDLRGAAARVVGEVEQLARRRVLPIAVDRGPGEHNLVRRSAGSQLQLGQVEREFRPCLIHPDATLHELRAVLHGMDREDEVDEGVRDGPAPRRVRVRAAEPRRERRVDDERGFLLRG